MGKPEPPMDAIDAASLRRHRQALSVDPSTSTARPRDRHAVAPNNDRSGFRHAIADLCHRNRRGMDGTTSRSGAATSSPIAPKRSALPGTQASGSHEQDGSRGHIVRLPRPVPMLRRYDRDRKPSNRKAGRSPVKCPPRSLFSRHGIVTEGEDPQGASEAAECGA